MSGRRMEHSSLELPDKNGNALTLNYDLTSDDEIQILPPPTIGDDYEDIDDDDFILRYPPTEI